LLPTLPMYLFFISASVYFFISFAIRIYHGAVLKDRS
jgi:hypothetical protein